MSHPNRSRETERSRRSLCGIITLLVVSLSGSRIAAQTTEEANAQNPAPINTIEVEGGYRYAFRSGGDNQSFYRINYLGSLVKSAGTPFKYANSLDLAAPAQTTGAGDRPKFVLRLEHGTTDVGGGLFEALGVKPLTLRGLERLNLRGSAMAAGDADAKKLQLSVGLELPPNRLPLFAGTEWSNWIVLGANVQRQEATDNSTEDKDFGLITVRSFAGKAFDWRRGADWEASAARLADAILKQAPTLKEAKALKARIERDTPAAQRSTPQQLFLDALGEEPADDAAWAKTVRDIARGDQEAFREQPTLSFYNELSGWWVFAGKTDGSHIKALFTSTIDWWLMPDRDNLFLRVRYENGYERATPDVRKNQLLVSAALRL